jgi:predicted metalloprotease with PDZ domain
MRQSLINSGYSFCRNLFICCCLIAFFSAGGYAQKSNIKLSFVVSTPQPSSNLYHVAFRCEGIKKDSVLFKLPTWTPGYYQIMDYADNVQDFKATTNTGKELDWKKSSKNSWSVTTNKENTILISYKVKATRPFVAANYLDEERGYISPAGVFIYPDGFIKQPVTVAVEPWQHWIVATGLDSLKGKRNSFYAADYDVLYDSPILMGNLERFPSFTVKGIPHHFIAWKPGDFDKNKFMQDLKKIITAASDIIGDIPYKQYTFLAIGPGGGGIEHLNSTSIAFSSNGLNSKEGAIRMYNFLAHEYFHHYNVKRIRPIELGPFDYDSGSKTKMLWLSEGITVYYEYIILKRAGLTTTDDVLKTFQHSIKEYESKPGRYFQTPAEASFSTWEEGPFGRTGDDVNKTISPYDKGPALGILLEFKIRHETKNKKSLDDVMRLLYNKYYKSMGRGFTEKEFQDECEKIAGTSLTDFFDYIYTLKQVDYPAYFNYAGLSIDTVAHEVPGAWLGITVKDRNDSLFIANTEWQSPAWNAGLRNRNAILAINGNKADSKSLAVLLSTSRAGDNIEVSFINGSTQQNKNIVLGKKMQSDYSIVPVANPDPLQKQIAESWLEVVKGSKK